MDDQEYFYDLLERIVEFSLGDGIAVEINIFADKETEMIDVDITVIQDEEEPPSVEITPLPDEGYFSNLEDEKPR